MSQSLWIVIVVFLDNCYLHNHENKVFADLFNINKLYMIKLHRRFLSELLKTSHLLY